jgi:hypothetical protein
MSAVDRSQSRGRETFVSICLHNTPLSFTEYLCPQHSSGRGGIGNIRQASASREARPDGPDDFSSSRGREPIPTAATRVCSLSHVYHF